MSRRWLGAVGAGLALIAGATVVLLMATPPPPFRFLEDRAPLQIHPDLASSMPGTSFYSWQEDYPRVATKATSELRKMGFTATDSHSLAVVFTRDAGPGTKPGDRVILERDHRLREPVDGNLDFEPGWVAVTVQIENPPSLWDRFKAIFGL
jgi:hypothetical protein